MGLNHEHLASTGKKAACTPHTAFSINPFKHDGESIWSQFSDQLSPRPPGSLQFYPISCMPAGKACDFFVSQNKNQAPWPQWGKKAITCTPISSTGWKWRQWCTDKLFWFPSESLRLGWVWSPNPSHRFLRFCRWQGRDNQTGKLITGTIQRKSYFHLLGALQWHISIFPCQSSGSFVKTGEAVKWIQARVPFAYFYQVSRAASAANHRGLLGRNTERGYKSYPNSLSWKDEGKKAGRAKEIHIPW